MVLPTPGKCTAAVDEQSVPKGQLPVRYMDERVLGQTECRVYLTPTEYPGPYKLMQVVPYQKSRWVESPLCENDLFYILAGK